MKLIDGDKIIEVGENKKEREILNGDKKLFGMVINVGKEIVYVMNGMYGDNEEIGEGV
jgi:hypothetical protein